MYKPELKLIIETVPDAVIILDGSGKIICANRAAETMLGLNHGDVEKHTYDAKSWKITTPEGGSLPEEELPFTQVMRSKKPVYGVVYAIEKPDGTRTILSINAAPLLDESGNIKSIVVSLVDITEQRRAADEIRESRRQVLDILESITDAFYALDNDWRFTYVNHRAEELFGIRREQLLFKNIWQVIPREQHPQIFEKYHQAKDEIIPVVFEDFSPRLNKWLEMHVYPYQNGISVYIRDITERKQAEQERAVNLHFFESMDRVNRAISTADDLEQAMKNALDEVLSIFDADRSYFLYPLDPEAPSWHIATERTKPGYESTQAARTSVPTSTADAARFRLYLKAKGPLRFGPGSEYPLTEEFRQRFGIGSLMAMAIYPRVGKPWAFGVVQSSYSRVWTDEEARILREIGRRIADGLTSLLIYRESQESEQKYREIFDKSLDGIIITSPEGKILDVNKRAIEALGYDTKEEVLGLDVAKDIYVNPADAERVSKKLDRDGLGEFDVPVKKKSGEIMFVHVSLNAVRDESGNITSYRGFVREIAEQGKARDNSRT
jgi:PAS domain S-box-containing protein